MLQEILKLTEKGIYAAITITDLKALKKSRLTKEPTPERFQNIKKYTYQIINLGHTYEDLVNNRLQKEGKANDFEAGKTYVEKYQDSLCVYQHSTKEQLYLRAFILLADRAKIKTVYVDGNGDVISKEEMEDIYAHYLGKKSEKTGQGGLEDQVEIRNFKLENVLYLKRKDNEIISNALTQDVLEMLINS